MNILLFGLGINSFASASDSLRYLSFATLSKYLSTVRHRNRVHKVINFWYLKLFNEFYDVSFDGLVRISESATLLSLITGLRYVGLRKQ